MTTPASLLPKVQAALGKRLRHASKRVYQAARWRSIDRPSVLFIVGCQRSGTTLMTRLFDADRDCRVFGEFSILSAADRAAGIRFASLPDVAAIINRTPAPLVVAKPLVETQNVVKLLNYLPGSKALFMYRRFEDVARSDLAKFGVRNGVDNLRPIAQGDPHNWRSAGASAGVREVVARFFTEDMNPNDAAALFWFARNHLYFDLNIPDRPAVMLCKYEQLVRAPAAVMRRIYDFVGVAAPNLAHTAEVHGASVSKGRGVDLSPEVRTLCEELQARLDAHDDSGAR